MGLVEYKRKRDFKKTAAAAGAAKARRRKTRANRFIIQKHDASRLHYDFRLEMDGVLSHGQCPKDYRGRRRKDISRLKWKIIRSITPISRASFPKANMVVAP